MQFKEPSHNNYFFENWLRGYAKDYLRQLSSIKSPLPKQKYHPKITFIRPFTVISSERELKETIINYCSGKKPIFFKLKNIGLFDVGAGNEKEIIFADVTETEELIKFDAGLEAAIENQVIFTDKLAEEKKFHATIKKPIKEKLLDHFEIEQYMLRFTVIKNKKIWFSYDYVTQEPLSRLESLDKQRWYKTIHEFTKQTGLLPTRQGYQRIK